MDRQLKGRPARSHGIFTVYRVHSAAVQWCNAQIVCMYPLASALSMQISCQQRAGCKQLYAAASCQVHQHVWWDSSVLLQVYASTGRRLGFPAQWHEPTQRSANTQAHCAPASSHWNEAGGSDLGTYISVSCLSKCQGLPRAVGGCIHVIAAPITLHVDRLHIRAPVMAAAGGSAGRAPVIDLTGHSSDEEEKGAAKKHKLAAQPGGHDAELPSKRPRTGAAAAGVPSESKPGLPQHVPFELIWVRYCAPC